MKRHDRLLALVVNARDLVVPHVSMHDAVAAAVASGALDLLQLRTDADDAATGVANVAVKQLAALLDRRAVTATTATHHWRQPVLIFNAPLDALMRHDALLQVRSFGGWHIKERDLVHADLPHFIKHARMQCCRNDNTGIDNNATANNNIAMTATLRLGCSVHSVESALLAVHLGFDYIQVGTMFATASHPDKAELEGPALLHAIAAAAQTRNVLLPPLVAVGGINTPQQTREVLRAGASGVAVIRGILQAPDSALAAAAYRTVLSE